LKAKGVSAVLACALLAALPAAGASAQTAAKAAAAKIEPYTSEEFPSWALDLRRADIVAFGALPFTVFFAQFAIDGWRFSQNSWDRRYAPWPLKTAGAVEMDENQRIAAFAAGCAGAATVALVDWILVSKRRARSERAEREKPKSVLTMKRSPWPPAELPPVDAAPVPAE
jgi:hypothetical protein